MYRLSELMGNGAILKEDIAFLYLEVLKSIQAIAYAELANANIDDDTKRMVFEQLILAPEEPEALPES